MRRAFCGALLATSFLGALANSDRAAAERIYSYAYQGSTGILVTFDSSTPGAIIYSGLPASANIGLPSGTDYQPKDPAHYFNVYADGNDAFLYRFHGTGAGDGTPGEFKGGIGGINFGFDINPVNDEFHLVNELDQNVFTKIVPKPSPTTFGPALHYVAGDPHAGVNPNVVDIAYSNNVVGALTTQLYGIDTGLDALVKVDTLTGELTTVGNLGVNVNATGGFDISGATGIAYAVLMPAASSVSNLYTIDLTTAAVSLVGEIDGGVTIHSMTVFPGVPEPTSIALVLAAALGVGWAGRRRG